MNSLHPILIEKFSIQSERVERTMNEKIYKNIIIGGGIAGLSLGGRLKSDCVIIEREEALGGLSRSYDFCGTKFDVGPHIIFSKNDEVLEKHSTMVPTNKIRRSNQIFTHGRYVKYPFENDLSSLPTEINKYCLHEFLHNPYEEIEYTNMQQFFLKTFGQGICDEYLLPYNKKIWKFDPACLDTQMVDRIPKPPAEDIIKSSAGENTEGYLHQLYYHYPVSGGFQSIINKYEEEFLNSNENNSIILNAEILNIDKDKIWKVRLSDGREILGEKLVNTAPIHEFRKLVKLPEDIDTTIERLLYNSIHIVMVATKKDTIGDHFALYIPDENVIFHRLSKLNYLGKNYSGVNGESILMAEVTFRPESALSGLSDTDVAKETVNGLVNLGFIDQKDLVSTKVLSEKYAYVIYDLNHRKNTDKVLSYLESIGIYSAGRFALFEYLNTDAVVEKSWSLAERLENDYK